MKDETLCIIARLESLAIFADTESAYVGDTRVMPAGGVARKAWDAIDHIKKMEDENIRLFHAKTLAEEWRDHDRQAAIDAKGKLANAAEALQDALEAWGIHQITGDSMEGWWVFKARAALAELKGGDQ